MCTRTIAIGVVGIQLQLWLVRRRRCVTKDAVVAVDETLVAKTVVSVVVALGVVLDTAVTCGGTTYINWSLCVLFIL